MKSVPNFFVSEKGSRSLTNCAVSESALTANLGKPGTLTSCTVCESALTANHALSEKVFAPVFISLRRFARAAAQPTALL
jgi:hypothetical protein